METTVSPPSVRLTEDGLRPIDTCFASCHAPSKALSRRQQKVAVPFQSMFDAAKNARSLKLGGFACRHEIFDLPFITGQMSHFTSWALLRRCSSLDVPSKGRLADFIVTCIPR